MYVALFILITILSIGITLSIKLKLISLKFAYLGLFTLVFLAFLLISNENPTREQIGIFIPSIDQSIIYLFTTIFICFLLWSFNKFLFKFKHNSFNLHKKWINHIFFYLIISAPAQEFLFRSFLYFSLLQMGALTLISMTVISSLLFTTAHIVFEDNLFILGTFVMGAIWGFIYFFIPNLILISLSHAIVGLFAFKQGFIKKDTFKLRVLPS